MSITYEEALQTLESMFGEPWTRDSLDEVLRFKAGHMEATVELILAHGDRDPSILIQQLESGVDPSQASAEMDEALARQLSGSSLAASASNNGKGTPVKLPDDFLRVPGFKSTTALQDDEALARMLQDELFTQELSRNPDFAHLATGRSNATRPPPGQRRSGSAPANPMATVSTKWNEFASRFQTQQPQRTAASGPPASPNVMEKLSEMGDAAKKRLQLLAAQFNAQNNTTGSVPARTSEFRGLLDEDEHETDNLELGSRKDL